MLKSSVSTRSVIEALESRIAPAAFTVTTTDDSGPGSLRQAILDANTLEGADTIGFNIEGEQLQIIALASPLPAITDQVTISALSNYESYMDRVQIDGTNAGPGAVGLQIKTNFSAISGISIANFPGSGVLITGNANTIFRSFISGSGEHGVHILDGLSNRLFANEIGAFEDSRFGSGTGNRGTGILIENADGTNLERPEVPMFGGGPIIGGIQIPPWGASGNAIRENGLFGAEIRSSDSVVIAGNEILGNGSQSSNPNPGGGIAIFDSKAVEVGTLSYRYANLSLGPQREPYVAGNTISSNIGHGVWISGVESSGTSIAGNSITTNISGDGVHIDGATDTSFGLLFTRTYKNGFFNEMAGNTISQNDGWGIAADGASDIRVLGSTFEGNITGAVRLDQVKRATIGGTGVYGITVPTYTFDANTFSIGTAPGISVEHSEGVQITSNSFSGTGVPIDLGGDGATLNDLGDIDTGANHLQNYPLLKLSSTDMLTGTLDTDAANTKYRIQLFKFDPATGYSLHSTSEITTGADGKAALNLGTLSLAGEQRIHATATNLVTGETSELSAAAIVEPVQPVALIGSTTIIEGNSGVQDMVFTINLDRATTVPVKVSYKSTANTATAGEDYSAVEGFVTFEPGETSKAISVPVFGDPLEEASESFYVELTAIENGVLSVLPSGIGTITNDDGIPTISLEGVPAVVYEGSTGSSSVPFTIKLSKPSLDPVTVRALGQLVTFTPGTTSVTKTFSVADNILREGNRTFEIQLSNPTAGVLGTAKAALTIIDDDGWVLEPMDGLTVQEGNDGLNVAVMTVRLWSPVGLTDHQHPVSVDFATLSGTALAGSDFEAVHGTLVFQPGEFEKTITTPLIADTVAEQNETFRVIFGKRVGADLTRSFFDVVILNDDPGAVSVSAASTAEGNSGQKMMVFNVGLSAPTVSPVSLNFETQGGSATAGIDFEAVADTLTFAPGETTKTISVPIYGDRTVEGNETFTLKLTSGSGATASTISAVGTILDDDPTLNLESAQFQEGQSPTSNTRTVFLPVRLTHATDMPVSVEFATSNGTAEAPNDYVATSGMLVFAPGQTLQFIELQIVGDLDFEPDETFSVQLSNLQGAEMGQATGVVTIKTDEPILSAQNVTLAEGNSGTKSLNFTVTLSQAQASSVSVGYATADGTATEGSDYTAVSGTLTFAPGETSKTVSVPILGDILNESNEMFRLLLSNATGAAIATAEIQGTIANDDSKFEVGLVVSKNGRKALWTDGDGDLVTLTSNKGALSQDGFQFGLDPHGLLSLQKLFLNPPSGRAAPVSLTFSVLKSGTSDGLVNVEVIHSFGDLNKLSLPGRLGSLVAGDFKLKTPAVHKLVVDSFGLDSLFAEAGAIPLTSYINGNVDHFVVKNNFLGAHLSVLNGGIRSLTVGGDIRGTDPLHPVEIKTEGAFHRIDVGGDVIHTDLIAGAIAGSKGVRAGKVVVQGDWTASNLVVGAEAGPDGLFGTMDDSALQGTPSRIARITIGGTISGTAESENPADHFGFVAGRIAAFQVGSSKMSLSSKWNDSSEIDSTSDVMLRELAGRVRA